MYCPKCGTEISVVALFCPSCGSRLKSEIFYSNEMQQPDSNHASDAPMRYAGFWVRFWAAMIDGLIFVIAGFILSLFFSLTGMGSDNFIDIGSFVIAGILVFLNWLYFAAFESSTWQATLGKRALGLIVTDLNGHRIGFGRATGRTLSKVISYWILFIGYLMAAFTEKKQALHDMIAGTLVIEKSKA